MNSSGTGTSLTALPQTHLNSATFPFKFQILFCGHLINWQPFCDLSKLVKCLSGWWWKHTTHLMSDDHGSRGGTLLRCLPEGYFIHTFRLPMSKEDSKPSKRRQHRPFLKSLHWAKHLQDNLGELWKLSSVGFVFVLRGH